MFSILYQNHHTLIVQTHAGHFDKWGEDLYGQYNMGMHVGDEGERVLMNRANLLGQLNELTHHRIQEIHWLNQIHSDVVVCLDDDLKLHNADALMTAKKGVALSIMTADCVPIALFNEADGGQIACIHAGWQGLVKGIIKNTANQFHDKNIKAVIGACISQKNYEIDMALARNIVNGVIEKNLVDLTFDELYQAIIEEKVGGYDHQKCLIDIVKLTRLQLAHLNIEVVNDDVPCSYDMPNLYSYRQQTHAQKRATGRMATLIARF